MLANEGFAAVYDRAEADDRFATDNDQSDIVSLAHNISFWGQKLTHFVSFWAQNLTHYVSIWIPKFLK